MSTTATAKTAAKPAPKAEPKPAAEAKPATDAKAYDPATDSTPDQKDRAAKVGRVVLDLSNKACLCGCKGKTPSRFLPGHDARLKGRLTRATLAKVGLLVLMDGQEQECEPRNLAEALSRGNKHDWVAALDAAVERASTQAEAAAKRRAENAKKAAERREAAAKEGKGKLSLSDFATV